MKIDRIGTRDSRKGNQSYTDWSWGALYALATDGGRVLGHAVVSHGCGAGTSASLVVGTATLNNGTYAVDLFSEYGAELRPLHRDGFTACGPAEPSDYAREKIRAEVSRLRKAFSESRRISEYGVIEAVSKGVVLTRAYAPEVYASGQAPTPPTIVWGHEGLAD